MHPALTPGTALEQALEDDFADTPGCEVRPSSVSDSCCGDPAVAYAVILIGHAHWCPQSDEGRSAIWLCEYHLQKARTGQLSCVPCNSVMVVVQLL